MLPLSSKAPDFNLPDPVSGEYKSLQQLKGNKGTLVMFICNHCPFVVHLEQGLSQLGRDYQSEDLGIIAISSNDASIYREDGPQQMAQKSKDKSYSFPYLYDESQSVAKAYQAACTPDFFLFNETLSCVYRGQFDDSRTVNKQAVTGVHLRKAIKSLLEGKAISADQKPSIGCNIKWKTD